MERTAAERTTVTVETTPQSAESVRYEARTGGADEIHSDPNHKYVTFDAPPEKVDAIKAALGQYGDSLRIVHESTGPKIVGQRDGDEIYAPTISDNGVTAALRTGRLGFQEVSDNVRAIIFTTAPRDMEFVVPSIAYKDICSNDAKLAGREDLKFKVQE